MPTNRFSSFLAPTALAVVSIVTMTLPAWSQVQGSHFLSNVQGNVVFGQFLIRPTLATNGRLVESIYKIRLGNNSQATLNCSNGGIHRFTSPGTYSVSRYCGSSSVRRLGANNTSRDPFNLALPYLLSPRNTALFETDTLTLRWNPVVGATSYTVSIQGRNVNQELLVNEPQATFIHIEALEPDYRYSVIITADNGLSSTTGASVGFAILPPEEAERVRQQVEAVQAQQLAPDTEAIALAQVYLGYEHSDRDRQSFALNQSALNILDTRIQAGTENSQIYLLQADIYLEIGLPLSAQTDYEQALTLSQNAGLKELQAESHLGLAIVAERQTDYAKAISHLKSAQALYEELGDRVQIDTLQTQIDRLSKEGP